MKRREFLSMGGLAASSLIADSITRAIPGADPQGWHESMRPLMGTYVTVALRCADPLLAQALLDGCFAEMERCIAGFSEWDLQSSTSRLNRERRISMSDCSTHVPELLRVAGRINELSGGALNVISSTLISLWRAAQESETLPEQAEIRLCSRRVKSSSVIYSEGEIVLSGDESIQFNALGEGYVADLACIYLRSCGVSEACVNCGGDISFLGQRNWAVDIVHPRENRALGTIKTFGRAGVGTSGDYNNSWFVGRRRLHHLIDVSSGMPGTFCQAVTVVAPSAVLADALSSAVFLMPHSCGLKLLNSLHDIEGLIIDSAGELHRTKGLLFTEGDRDVVKV